MCLLLFPQNNCPENTVIYAQITLKKKCQNHEGKIIFLHGKWKKNTEKVMWVLWFVYVLCWFCDKSFNRKKMFRHGHNTPSPELVPSNFQGLYLEWNKRYNVNKLSKLLSEKHVFVLFKMIFPKTCQHQTTMSI